MYAEILKASHFNTVTLNDDVSSVIGKIENSGMRCIGVCDEEGKFVGLIHDTDLRRAVNATQGFEKVADLVNQEVEVAYRSDGAVEIVRQVTPLINKNGELYGYRYLPSEMEIKELTEFSKVGVVGLGYVGATLAITLASSGLNVVGMDRNESLVKGLASGELHFFEENAEQKLADVIRKGRLSVFSDYSAKDLDVIFISVGTPLDLAGNPNVSYLEDAFRLALDVLAPSGLICLRSTIPVGTCRRLYDAYPEHFEEPNLSTRAYLAMCPERTIEGAALKELYENPQLIGTKSKIALEKSKHVFQCLNVEIIDTPSFDEVELAKLVDNTSRDLKFAYANMLAALSLENGLNINRVIGMVNQNYTRTEVARPSPGVGGPCLTKDTKILMSSFPKHLNTFGILEEARRVNHEIIYSFIDRLLETLADLKVKDAVIHVLGLAFKGNPETSDLRDSTTLLAIDYLNKKGVKVLGYDVVVDVNDPLLNCELIDESEIGSGADAICVLNNHASFINLEWEQITSNMNNLVLFDGWGLLDNREIRKHFDFYMRLGG